MQIIVDVGGWNGWMYLFAGLPPLSPLSSSCPCPFLLPAQWQAFSLRWPLGATRSVCPCPCPGHLCRNIGQLCHYAIRLRWTRQRSPEPPLISAEGRSSSQASLAFDLGFHCISHLFWITWNGWMVNPPSWFNEIARYSYICKSFCSNL